MNNNGSARTGRPFSLRSRRLSPLSPRFGAAIAVLGIALVGCGQGSDSREDGSGSAAQANNDAQVGGQDTRVLWMGDSIAGTEGPALGEALKASGVEFKDVSSDGGGNVVGGDKMIEPIARDTWERVPKDIKSFRPTVVAYQITTYDWGSKDQQRTAYEKLARTAKDAGAKLVLVAAPPFEIGDFYKDHKDAIRTAPEAAKEVAQSSGGAVVFLDSAQLWGTDAKAKKAQRSSDLVHNCQQGAAAFAKWFTEQLGKQSGFTPASVDTWAEGSWAGDKRYADLKCGI
ncbi:SGNH/GDSL hydrolase family protein [Streptomyces sp. 2231.1]|uniref:SGNH/GDSL hydrolase family protein n=1 Tax=Streptomyces sp. 2231.1 TaxID=1855347 RepID=UPI00210A6F19|nr:SGNH/GDSL hydrolase family protein [Streptomyces sp. 2231.1]